jgi:ADP-ribose pyrophosphatase YjhB (NUDIX family)
MTTKKFATGGVVLDKSGQVLLIEPKGHFDGYAWTFPQGRPNPGETAEEAALRRVVEESGIFARIVGLIPKVYNGDATQSVYFVMRPVAETGTWSAETHAVRWVAPVEAADLIGRTTNADGKLRDIAVLHDALELMARLTRGLARD